MDNQEIKFLLYSLENETGNIEVVAKDETLWATQKAMSVLFDVGIPAIAKHLSNVYESGELEENRTISILEIVRNEGNRKVSREVKHYNLDAIISVGYRVNSQKATHFRQWATNILKNYIRKGYLIDSERMEQGGTVFGKDYFREMLETVRAIRSSERRIWLQLTDIFAEISYDYDKNSELTKQFFATVQNKFHFAITGQTASEIIYDKADESKAHMGLETWKKAPEGRILQSDVIIAKNYLQEKQIRRLEREVSGYFDYVERLLEAETAFTMQDFAKSIDEFLSFNRYEVLEGKGKISGQQAKDKAISEYKKFNKTQKIVSDFEKDLKNLVNEN
ncbi:MAG: virulence RhuM family protein [Streptococcaceae bacterium]|nr:virulence RhuM family protein [Streptococcaceae bacterium]